MKILVVFTGGTIGSGVDREGFFSPDQKTAYKLLQIYKKSFQDHGTVFETVEPYTILSEYLDGECIDKLIGCVKSHLDEDYDGIIVTHGTDTIQYSSSALGYAIGNKSIPVVLVSSNYILDNPRMNGLANFRAAVRFIEDSCGTGVFVSYRNPDGKVYIHRGTRLRSHDPYVDDLHSVCEAYYGYFENDTFVKNDKYTETDNGGETLSMAWKESTSRVAWITPYPGICWNAQITEATNAVLLSTFHSGTLNTESAELHNLCRTAMEKGIPVYLIGAVEEAVYSSIKVFEELGIRILPVISPISAYVKLSMALKADGDTDKIMSTSMGGDIININGV